ncbi:hypothetical protein HN51_047382 [Arachis hypogaea]
MLFVMLSFPQRYFGSAAVECTNLGELVQFNIVQVVVNLKNLIKANSTPASSANSIPASCINEPFRALRNDRRLAPSSTSDNPQTPTECTEIRHRNEVVDKPLEDEDYDLEADEVEGCNDDTKRKDTDY